MTPVALDLFGGIGGVTLGALLAGRCNSATLPGQPG